MAPLSTTSLLRPYPAWRWLRARALVETRSRCSRREDLLVRQTTAYLRYQRRHPDRCIPDRFDSIDEAVQLQMVSCRQRWMLEAYILARVPWPEIAVLLSIPESVIELFVRLFFDLGDLRDAPDALISYLLDGRRRDCIPMDDEEWYLRFYAVVGGRTILESLAGYYQRRHLSRLPLESLSQEERECRPIDRAIHLALLARAISVSGRHALLLSELARQADTLIPSQPVPEPLSLPPEVYAPLESALAQADVHDFWGEIRRAS